MTFTKAQQRELRAAFIAECHQKAWGALCHADWIAKELDSVLAHYQKLQEEDRTLEADIKAADNAIDYHTTQNRQKRKAMQERRNAIKAELDAVAKNAGTGQQSLQNLHHSAESNLLLAKHAKTWERKEISQIDTEARRDAA